MPTDFLFDGPDDARVTIMLAHGAGAPMDSASMTAAAKALSSAGLRVARFEFAYMAERRTGAGRKPPPRADKLMPEYRAAIVALGATTPLIIGGKSMGGRIASMIKCTPSRPAAKETRPPAIQAWLTVIRLL